MQPMRIKTEIAPTASSSGGRGAANYVHPDAVPHDIRHRLAEERVVSIAASAPRGRALISYVLSPFTLPPGEKLPNHHTQFWEARAIADAFLAEGYSVDVINYMNQAFQPRRSYDFVLDVRWNLERLSPVLDAGCTKIMHVDIAHVLFHNEAEARRLLELQRRRGVTLMPRRHERPNRCIEESRCSGCQSPRRSSRRGIERGTSNDAGRLSFGWEPTAWCTRDWTWCSRRSPRCRNTS
jgi:hypothetical protein